MKTRMQGVLCAVMVCLAAAAFAQSGTTPSSQNNMTVTGSVVSMSGDQVVVRTDAGETMTFDRSASITTPADVMVGSRVTVRYDRSGTGNPRLSSIMLATDQSGTQQNDNRNLGQGTANPTDDQRTGAGSGTSYDNNNTGYNTTGTGYDRLPGTASPLVLVALAGLVSLGGALTLRRRRQRG